MLNIALLASGEGSNAARIFEMAAAGILDVQIRLVICNRPGARVIERAKNHGLPVLELDHKTFPDRESFDRHMVKAIREAGADSVVLAGYMRLLTPYFLASFPNRVINIHPAILPSFPGVSGIGEAAAYGVKLYGCTVHFVNEITDGGAIIIQAALPVHESDTENSMLTRVHTAEHRIYPQALQWWSEGRLSIDGRRVRVLPKPGAIEVPQPDGMLISPPLEQGF